jgi:hypothetical protein
VHSHGNQTVGTLHAVVTGAVNGFMSSTDKTKLDNATASNTVSTLVIRDASGNFAGGVISCNTTTAATDTQTGSLIVSGGASIAKSLYTTDLHVVSTTGSSTTNNGSVIIAGGIGIANSVNIGGVEKIWTTTDASDTQTGVLQVAGGTSIVKNLYVGGSFNASTTTLATLSITSTTNATDT